MSDRILIVDEDDALRESLQLALAAEGVDVRTASGGEEALRLVDGYPAEIIFCELEMRGFDGMELLPKLARRLQDSSIIMTSARGTREIALEASRCGAFDYLAKPFAPSEAVFAMRRAREHARLREQNALLSRDVERAVGDRPIVAASSVMIDLLEMMERSAAYKTTVLLNGEAGTGKEVLARAIHAQSPRRREAFVAVECRSNPESLESELFGHAKGAFSGAIRARRGLFMAASGGTLFLDEIALLPMNLQIKLLRVLQEEEVLPVGESKSRPVDVRVIAATAFDLESEVAAGRFRKDLFYRLNVLRLEVPPLRARPKDISLLVDHYFARDQELLGKRLHGIADDALDALVAYPWPGNVRELRNVIERAVARAEGDRLGLRDLPEEVVRPTAISECARTPDLNLRRARRSVEIDFIEDALRATGGNRTHAAKLLEISHRALLYKIKEYGIRGCS